MKTYRFYKEIGNRWYVDLPEWPGEKSDLEMVLGADLMLEIISQGEAEVKLTLSDQPVNLSSKLEFIRLSPELGEGAYYKLSEWSGIRYDLDVWLCDVTKWVFGDFPKAIWIF